MRVVFKENPLLSCRIKANLDIFTRMPKPNGVVQAFEGDLSIPVDLAIKSKGGQVIKYALDVKKNEFPILTTLFIVGQPIQRAVVGLNLRLVGGTM